MAEDFLGSSSELSSDGAAASSSEAMSSASGSSSDGPPARGRRPSGPADADQVTADDLRDVPPR